MTLFKRVTPIALSALLLIGSLSLSPAQAGPHTAKAPTEKTAAATKTTPAAPAAPALTVSPMDLVKTPVQYMEKTVQFEGTFNRFADIGLDYEPAMRDSRDYVSLLVLRPDVTHHTIPLSELKLFYPREKSDDVTELETGDKVRIHGKVFSAALDEPWVDVTQIEIIEKTKTPGKTKKESLKD